MSQSRSNNSNQSGTVQSEQKPTETTHSSSTVSLSIHSSRSIESKYDSNSEESAPLLSSTDNFDESEPGLISDAEVEDEDQDEDEVEDETEEESEDEDSEDEMALIAKAYVEKIEKIVKSKDTITLDEKLVGCIERLCLDQTFTQDDARNVILPWLDWQATLGSANAAYLIGCCYENEYGLACRLTELLNCYKKAAEMGSQKAKNKFEEFNSKIKFIESECSYSSSLTRREYKDNYVNHSAREIKKITIEAEKGDMVAQYTLAILKSYRKDLSDMNGSVKFATLAAKQGHFKAQNFIGECYLHGIGVEKDIEAAFRWFERAARYGFDHACYNLFSFYRDGIYVEKNEIYAMSLLATAAVQDCYKAQIELAKRYETGNGVKKDMKLARQFRERAARNPEKTITANVTEHSSTVESKSVAPTSSTSSQVVDKQSETREQDNQVTEFLRRIEEEETALLKKELNLHTNLLKSKLESLVKKGEFKIEIFETLHAARPDLVVAFHPQFIKYYLVNSENTASQSKLFAKISSTFDKKKLKEILIPGLVYCLEIMNKARAAEILRLMESVDEQIGGTEKTALMLAAEKGHLTAASALLEEKASISLKTSGGKTALNYALEAKHYDVAVRLIIVQCQRHPKGNHLSDVVLSPLLPEEKDVKSRLFLYMTVLIMMAEVQTTRMLYHIEQTCSAIKQLGKIQAVSEKGIDIAISYKSVQSRETISFDEMKLILSEVHRLEKVDENGVKDAVIKHVLKAQADAKLKVEIEQEWKVLDDFRHVLLNKLPGRIAEAKKQDVDAKLVNEASDLLNNVASIFQGKAEKTTDELSTLRLAMKESEKKVDDMRVKLQHAADEEIKNMKKRKREWKSLDDLRQKLTSELSFQLTESKEFDIDSKLREDVLTILNNLPSVSQTEEKITPEKLLELRQSVEDAGDMRAKLQHAMEEEIIKMKREWKLLDDSRQKLIGELSSQLTESKEFDIDPKLRENALAVLNNLTSVSQTEEKITPAKLSDFKRTMEENEKSVKEMNEKIAADQATKKWAKVINPFFVCLINDREQGKSQEEKHSIVSAEKNKTQKKEGSSTFTASTTGWQMFFNSRTIGDVRKFDHFNEPKYCLPRFFVDGSLIDSTVSSSQKTVDKNAIADYEQWRVAPPAKTLW